MARKSAQIISVGDTVRLPLNEKNEYRAPHPAQLGAGAGAIEGLVCSIRQVAKGEFVATAAGNLRQYVVEVLVNQSFHPSYAGERNVGDRPTPRVGDNPVWRQVRDRLVALRNEGALPAGGAAVMTGPLKDLVDNWRLVKVRAAALQPVEALSAAVER